MNFFELLNNYVLHKPMIKSRTQFLNLHLDPVKNRILTNDDLHYDNELLAR